MFQLLHNIFHAKAQSGKAAKKKAFDENIKK
jgi:hypothetical protein